MTPDSRWGPTGSTRSVRSTTNSRRKRSKPRPAAAARASTPSRARSVLCGDKRYHPQTQMRAAIIPLLCVGIPGSTNPHLDAELSSFRFHSPSSPHCSAIGVAMMMLRRIIYCPCLLIHCDPYLNITIPPRWQTLLPLKGLWRRSQFTLNMLPVIGCEVCPTGKRTGRPWSGQGTPPYCIGIWIWRRHREGVNRIPPLNDPLFTLSNQLVSPLELPISHSFSSRTRNPSLAPPLVIPTVCSPL